MRKRVAKRAGGVGLRLASLCMLFFLGAAEAQAQATLEETFLTTSPFDTRLKQFESTWQEIEFAKGLNAYFKKFCGGKPLTELVDDRFVCAGRSCSTTRTGSPGRAVFLFFSTRAVAQQWHISVDFSGKQCPTTKVTIKQIEVD
jgi:hypothetical protein